MKVLAYIHSETKKAEEKGLKKEHREVELIKNNGNNDCVVRLEDGTECTAIYNTFAGCYYADNLYGIIKASSSENK